MRHAVNLLAAVIGLSVLTAPAFAQVKLEGPVKLVVGFAAGGGTDLLARVLADQVSHDAGIPVLVENKPGALGQLAVQDVVRSKPDGKTLLLTPSSSLIVAPHLQGIEGSVDKLQPVTLLTRFAPVILVKADSPFKTVSDFMQAGKSGKKLTYATSGIGSINHLTAERLARAGGIEMVHVPFSGSGQATTAVLGGQVDLVFAAPQSAAPLIRDGQLRALATSSAQRTPILPDVPTIAESGLAEFESSDWLGLLAPAGTSDGVTDALRQAFVDALRAPKVQAIQSKDGSTVEASGTAEFSEELNANYEAMGKFIKELGLKAQ
jgi:tripartite-type tricarboxylate transporter receptor subunit TctC